MKVFYFHLFLSVLLAIVLICFVFISWFPGPMLWIDGSWKILLLVFFVDLVIGPLLTLFITRKPKKLRALAFDLAIIMVLQAGAFVYGFSLLSNQRIEGLVYLNEFFHVVAHDDVLENYHDNGNLQYYNKIAVGALHHDNFSGLAKVEIELKMNNISRFYRLDHKLVSAKNVDFNVIPLDVRQRYQEGFIIKFLVGKARNGLVVLNNNRDVVDIVLANEDNKKDIPNNRN